MRVIVIQISYSTIVVDDYIITTDNVTSEKKIVMMADLHNHVFGNSNLLIELIGNQKPDLVLICGDMLNSYSENSYILVGIIQTLKRIGPIFYSLGNHEIDYIQKGHNELSSELDEAGAIVLGEEFKSININGDMICIGGMYSYSFGYDGAGHMDKNSIQEETRDLLEKFETQDCFKL